MILCLENLTVRAAIVWSAVCISDVMNKAGMCGKSIKYVTSQYIYIYYYYKKFALY